MDNCQEELNRRDGELGDGDLGVTMARGMATINTELDLLPDDFGMALFACAKCFTRVSGSSYGTLLATGLMAAARSCRGQSTVAWAQIPQLLGLAKTAMQVRGKAKLGDKTVLDMLDGLQCDLDGIAVPAKLGAAAVASCAATLDAFRDKQAQQGRARFYGTKSIGKDDPGMVALMRIVEALAS